MSTTKQVDREQQAAQLLQKIQKAYFFEMSCDAQTLYNAKKEPVEFYGKIYKKELFWKKHQFLVWQLYLPYIKEIRFMEIRLTGPVSFSGFTMKFSELVKSGTMLEINNLFIDNKFWVNCSFQHK